MSPDASLGPLIRLRGLKRSQLPSPSASPEELRPFLTALLSEAVPFIDSVAPKSSSPASSSSPSPWKAKSTKSFPASAAPVRLLERRIPASSLPPPPATSSGGGSAPPREGETWVCRVSQHKDRAARGTASWDEFARALRDAHAETEEAFTPAVVAARRAAAFEHCGRVAPVEVAPGGDVWGRFALAVVEMRHAVGRPVLQDRVFPVLQMTASVLGRDGAESEASSREFVVVSVTVDDFGGAPEAEHAKAGDVVVASYASVERVRKVAEGAEGAGKIEWIMATASDAKGVLPAWVQKAAVPGQVAKDVSLFLGWIAKEREKGGVAGEQKRGDGGA